MPEGAYNTDFEPAVRPGDYLEIPNEGRVFEVTDYIPQPGIEWSVTVDANDVERNVEADELEMPDGLVGQFRILDEDAIPSDVTIEVDLGGREAMAYATKNQRGRWDENTVAELPNGLGTELWMYEDDDLYFTVTNDQGDETTVDLVFRGYHYRVEPADPGENTTPVYIANRPLPDR